MNKQCAVSDWDVTEIIGNYALQYQNTGIEENADFQVVPRYCVFSDCDCDDPPVIRGTIMWEGVRHIFFNCDADQENDTCGYIYYPHLLSMANCLQRLHAIALEKFESYRKAEEDF